MSGPRFTVDVLAPDYKTKIGTFSPGNLLSASCSWMWWSVGTATLYVREEGPEAAQLLKHQFIPVPVTMKPTGYPRWDGYVVYSALTRKAGLSGRITATLVGNRKWIDRVLAAPVPGSPWSNQTASEYDTRTGPLATVVRQYMSANIARIKASGQAQLPLRVTPIPASDTSPVITINARNQVLGDELESAIEANGYDVVSYLWLPGDPQPPGMLLSESTVILDVVKARERNYVNFTDESGGIAERTVAISAPKATALVVGGPGEGTARTFDYVRALTPTPERTVAAQYILDRLKLVVPAMTRAAKEIRDYLNTGGEYRADWLYEGNSLLVGAYYQRLLQLYPGNTLDRNASISWLSAYISANGGVSTIPVPDKTKAADAIRQRVSSDAPYFPSWTWVGADEDVMQYAPELVREYNGNTGDRVASAAWLAGYVGTFDGQEFLPDWTWYSAPIVVGVHARALRELYGGDPNNWAASRAWLTDYIAANMGAAELYPGMYSEDFFDVTSEPSSAVRVTKGKERLGELAGKVAMEIRIDDERPWKAGPDKDYWVGDLVRASFSGTTTIDHITRVTVSDNAEEGFRVTSQLGDLNMTESSDIRLANIVRQLAQEVSSLKAKR